MIRTYVVSAPIIAYYYSELVGDARNPPTLLAAAGFSGIAVIGTENISYFVYYCLMFHLQMQILTEMAATTGMLPRIICTFFPFVAQYFMSNVLFHDVVTVRLETLSSIFVEFPPQPRLLVSIGK